MSDRARAEIEALRASERLQGIFAGGPGDRPGASDGRRAARVEPAPPEARETMRPARAGPAWTSIGLIALALGIGALAVGFTGSREDMARVAPVVQLQAQAPRGGAPAEPETVGRAPQTPRTAEAPRHASAEFGSLEAAGRPARTETPTAASKSADDLAKSMDVAAIIRESLAAARSAQLREVRAGTDAVAPSGAPGIEPLGVPGPANGPAAAMTVPQPTWMPQAAAPAAAAAPGREAQSTASSPPARPSVSPLEAVETVPQPRAVPGEIGSAAAPGPRVAAKGAPARAHPADPARIVLHYRGAAGEETARRLASALRAHGLGRAELRRVSAEVAQANIRFFYAENRPVADRVGAFLRAMGRGVAMRDFTHYSPLPSVGTVEVWLPG
jgi:hypothetical protein